VVIRAGTNINLAALGTDEVQFLYCAADSTLPGMAAGRDAILIASPLVGLPYVIIARKEIRAVQDLKGKSIGVGSVAGLPYRLKSCGAVGCPINFLVGEMPCSNQPDWYAVITNVAPSKSRCRF
jgi:hypothetical protein